MANPTNITDAFLSAMHSKRVEPVKRLVGGRYGWAIHRFPIKGGISLQEVLARNICANNSLYKALLRVKP